MIFENYVIMKSTFEKYFFCFNHNIVFKNHVVISLKVCPGGIPQRGFLGREKKKWLPKTSSRTHTGKENCGGQVFFLGGGHTFREITT